MIALFKKADPFGEGAAQRAVEEQSRAVVAVEKILVEAEKTASKVKEKLDRALGESSKLRAELAKVQNDYVEDPSSALAKKIRSVKDKVELAELRERKPREASISADRARDDAALAVARALQELAEKKQALHVAELRRVASLENFRSTLSPVAQEVIVAVRARIAAVEKLDAVLLACLAASEELRTMGVDCAESTPIDPVHILGPFIDTRTAEEPTASDVLLGLLGFGESMGGGLRHCAHAQNTSHGKRPAGLLPVINVVDELLSTPPGKKDERKILEKYFLDRTMPLGTARRLVEERDLAELRKNSAA